MKTNLRSSTLPLFTSLVARSSSHTHATPLRRLAAAGALLAAFTGCDPAVDEDDTRDNVFTADSQAALDLAEDDMQAGGAAPSPGELSFVTTGGTLHTGTIDTAKGPREVTYEVFDGRAMFEGDIDLGPVDDRGELMHNRGNAPKDANKLWPGGEVPFVIDPNLVNPARVNAAIATLEAATSLRFHARTTNEPDYIFFTTSTRSGVSSSPVGRQGGQQNVRIWTTHQSNTIVHEIMHSLGVNHEQTRKDRNGTIVVNWQCIADDDEHNFETDPNTWDLEPYDLSSIMHYSPSQFCERDASNACICPTMTAVDGISTIGSGGVMTSNDINGLYRMYHRPLGVNENQDGFGGELASGDFDGDGYDDLAVGIPQEAWGQTRAGAVALYKGVSNGTLIPWKMISQSSLGVLEEGDEFGRALAAGDFNGDGFVDLAVGAPGEGIGSVAEAGAVFVFRGSATGLSAWQEIDQVEAGGATEADDRFGGTLAAGDFNGDGRDDLAVTSIGDGGTVDNAGWVFVLKGATSGLVSWTGIGQGTLDIEEAGDEFGYSLATAKLNNDGLTDLVVGSPNSGAGAAFLFKGSASGPLPWKKLTQSDVGGAEEDFDTFGFSLAVGDFSGDGRADIAIGAPGESVGSVEDAGFVYMFKSTGTDVVGWHSFGQSPLGATEANDWFGASLAAGEVWTTASNNRVDLIVGSPGEAVGTEATAGAAFVFSGGGTTMVGRQVITAATATAKKGNASLPTPDAGARLGDALCVGDFNGDGDGDLIVGIPQQHVGAVRPGGALHFYNSGINSFSFAVPLVQSLVYPW